MGGLDDLIGGLQKAQSGSSGGGESGLQDILGGILGGGSTGGGRSDGGLGDILGGALGGGSQGGGGGGLGDILGGVLGQGAGGGRSGGAGGLGSLMTVLGPILASLLANGGLSKILNGMRGNGLSAQADSWVGTGENESVSPDEVRQALGEEQVQQVASQLGVGPDDASRVLAGVLPGLVNTVTPDGEQPSDDDLDRLAGTLEGFGR